MNESIFMYLYLAGLRRQSLASITHLSSHILAYSPLCGFSFVAIKTSFSFLLHFPSTYVISLALAICSPSFSFLFQWLSLRSAICYHPLQISRPNLLSFYVSVSFPMYIPLSCDPIPSYHRSYSCIRVIWRSYCVTVRLHR
ncbi:hypothetical protein GALMADRAFT_1063229 [Galerina marginata CBS 339.88]|uniref:Uncharacterized protein n=1 Tax=Galerina marginata (strain CBS 339.88) TaxID=685588 RepID=A0A067SAC9_GALM3|nr:hypothetical protein GALMADRAFT_1063229 [Galerina marginata CBS 339.88]